VIRPPAVGRPVGVTTSRRGLLLAAASAGAVIVAGCGRAARRGSGPPGAASQPASAPLSTSTASPPPAATAPTTPTRSTGRAAGAPAVQVAHGRRTRQEVSLTFHGQGDPVLTRELLAIFAEHSARVTVLAVGTWLAQYPAIAHEILGGGHELGNHTYHHLDINSLDATQARQEIVRCRDLLVSLTGSPGPYFRQSQAPVATKLVRRLAGRAGYPVCLSYDVDSLDYTDPGPAVVRRRLRQARAGSIVSMHLGHPGTVTAMPGILHDLADRGLRPVPAGVLLRS
jgi:peptidoglycan/xylan/chitin deacetylase (PgdA/CDA1 family)